MSRSTLNTLWAWGPTGTPEIDSKVMFCRVCAFRVGFEMYCIPHRSSGQGYISVAEPAEAGVGSVMLYPVPVPAPAYFYRTHRSFGYGLKCVKELTEAREGL